MLNLTNKHIAIVTHRSLMPDIPGGDLKKFFLNHSVNSLIYITHPLLLLKESYELSSQYEYYKNNKLVNNHTSYNMRIPEVLSYIKDFIYTLFWVIKINQKFDTYFGINNMNALGGLILKKLGRCKTVVYYTIDLYPQRFPNKIINWIYHKIDKFCVKYCDETWNVSPFLVTYRAKKGIRGKDYSRQFTVPIGIWFDEMKRVPINKVKKTKIVYVGHLKNFYGVDLIIQALPLIIKKISTIKLDIIGGGEQTDELQKLSKDLKVSSYVRFLGWKDKKEAERLISDASLGLAAFNTNIIDEKLKNADPAKIKDYLALGLPVVMTNASLNAAAINKNKCGIIIDYTPEDLAKAVIKLVSNRKLQQEYSQNALKFVEKFDWNILFTKNTNRLL